MFKLFRRKLKQFVLLYIIVDYVGADFDNSLRGRR